MRVIESLPSHVTTLYEGSSGSTAISLTRLGKLSRGLKTVAVVPDDQSEEKLGLLEMVGAKLIRVKPASIVHPDHYVNVARRLGAEDPNGYFADQFENEDNFRVHYETTGVEILREAPSGFAAFVASAGTGGTIAGVARRLKEDENRRVLVVLADPQGSSLGNKINHGVLFTREQSERTVRRHRYDTIVEGVGLDRLTRNLALGLEYIDYAVTVTDEQVVRMARYLLRAEGLFVGSSSALNCVAAVKVAMSLPEGSAVVTMLCSSGERERRKLYDGEETNAFDRGEEDFVRSLLD